MIESLKTSGAKRFFFLILVFLIVADLAILLNIPLLRQILGFLFLTLLPGLLILQILKLKTDFLERFILTCGLSISFVMFFGLLINNLSLSLGYETPLSITPLFISLNLAFILLIIIGYKTKTFEKSFIKTNFLGKNRLLSLNLSTSEKAFLIVPISFPALSIFGMNLMNTTDNNTILMLLLFLIPIYVIFVCFFNQKFPKRIYPIVIFLIGISLILILALRSNHIIGYDTHVEYYFFQTTLDNTYWSVLGHSTLDACLSISLLPTIYHSVLNINSEFLFKILYSLLYSVSPLVIYVLSKRYIGESYAFLASCFFMFQLNFLWTELHARTNTAILFFALAMMTLFYDKIDPVKKRILFIVFMASCMVSHYSTTYIFFFIMFGTFIGMKMLSKKYKFKKVISLTIMLLFFTFIFFWYSQVTETAFTAGVDFVGNTLSNLNKLFVKELMSTTTQSVLGKEIMQRPIPSKIEFVFTWITFVFIAIGIITLIRRRKEMSFPELNFEKPDFLKEKFEVGYFVIAVLFSGLFAAVVAIPHITAGYSLERTYSVGIVVLSVFFVIGGITLSKHFFFFKKKTCAKRKNNSFFDKAFFSKERFEEEKGSQARAYLIILLVLIPYFLCVTGATYQVSGYPGAITLNSEGGAYDVLYVHDQESYSARWLRSNADEKRRIYTDFFGGLWLSSQGMVPIRSSIYDPSFIEDKEAIGDGYIFLRYVNVVGGKLMDRKYQWHNLTEYDHLFVDRNKIYDNDGPEVWR